MYKVKTILPINTTSNTSTIIASTIPTVYRYHTTTTITATSTTTTTAITQTSITNTASTIATVPTITTTPTTITAKYAQLRMKMCTAQTRSVVLIHSPFKL